MFSKFVAPKNPFPSNKIYSCEISGSHGGEYEDDCLLGCCAV
jgi:hypothetical protein